MLRSTNNVVAWLEPSPVVAKIGISRDSQLALELAVARELAALGASIAAPATVPPPQVYQAAGVEITFWRYHRPDAEPAISADAYARGLRELHGALSRLSAPLLRALPSYARRWEDARALLASQAPLSGVSEADRLLLAKTLSRLAAELEALAPAASHRALHGAPHLYNILSVGHEPLFIDLETCCTGPVEWDLAYFDDKVARRYGAELDPRLLWLSEAMASVTTAVWCAADSHRGDLAEHAAWHLARLKEDIAPQLFGAG